MGGDDDAAVVVAGEAVEDRHQSGEVPGGIDVLLAMGADDEVAVFGESESAKDVGGLDPGKVMVEDLEHRAAGLDDAVRGRPSRRRNPGDRGVGEVDVGEVVDDLAIDLLGNALIEAAVAGLHMEDGNLAALGRVGGEAAVGVAEDQEGVGAARRSSVRSMMRPTVWQVVVPAASRKWSGFRISRSSKNTWLSS